MTVYHNMLSLESQTATNLAMHPFKHWICMCDLMRILKGSSPDKTWMAIGIVIKLVSICHSLFWTVILNAWWFEYMAVPSFPEVEKNPHTYKTWYYFWDTLIGMGMFALHEFATYKLGTGIETRLRSIEENTATKKDLE